ncbi:MAG: hypothetical protein HY028_09575 [Gammaproteobacteria bacterium]|nr:hypothetical protein [Gammaproteobacteria bacterium]
MKLKEICLQLLEAESETAVQAIIEEVSEFRKASNWKPLDGRETNFNITSNQASDGGKALTELMTNMVDAVLMKHAYLKKIDPKGPDAPRTMYEAVDKLVKPLQGGKLVNLDPNDPWLREFASKNLVIGVAGAKNKKEGLPCYTFVDNGEGQKPQDFVKTFLSLSEGNKRSIPFVQGKYNMGSSGVLGYCGRRWFKLIVSRRYDGKTPWGWTLMRRRPGEGMPIAEYFVLPDGSIPSFEADLLHPFHRGDGKRYDGVHIATGTIIKLYDYQVGSRFLSFRGPREALNENLVETILPFRLLDFRQKPDPTRGGERAEGIDPRPFYGMEFLLLRSHKEGSSSEADDDTDDHEIAADGRLTVGKIEDPDLGEISISAIALKRKLPNWLKPSNTNNRVFHALNGQVQFKQTRGYLTDCGFPALKDRVVVIVDASNLSFSAHNDVWKGDREHIRNTIVGERYRELVTATIKESIVLKELQIKVAREEMESAAKTERNDLFQKLVDKDPTLANLLTGQDPIIRLPASGGTNGHDEGKGEFEGKYSPTFLRLEEKVRDQGIDLPINRTRPIAARTDAENGYLGRADNQGQLVLPDEITTRFALRTQLHNGRLTVYFDPIEAKLKAGDTFTFHIGLHDPAIPLPVEDELTIRITDEETAPVKPKVKKMPTEPKGGKGEDHKGDGDIAPTHGLPKHKLLTKDGRKVGDQESDVWPDGFTDQDGGTVHDLGDGRSIYFINYDNVYHLKYKMQARGDIAKDVMTEKYILGMRILMLGYEHALRLVRETNGNGIAEFFDEFRRMAARGAASTILAIAENLPKIVDSSSVAQEAE